MRLPSRGLLRFFLLAAGLAVVATGCAADADGDDGVSAATASAITDAEELLEDKEEHEIIPVLPDYIDRIERIGAEVVELATHDEGDDAEDDDGVDVGDVEIGVEDTGLSVQSASADAARLTSNRATWAYHFVAVSPNGAARVLSKKNETRRMLGASTFKMFTGWAGLKAGATDRRTIDAMLTTSNNATANLTLCQAGAKLGGYTARCRSRSSADAQMKMGQATGALKTFLTRAGVRLSATYRQTDGSGLSSANVLVATDLTSLLQKIRTDAQYEAYRKMLAQPNKRGSTIRGRFRGYESRVFAKTGTYPRSGNGTKALAGFVTPKSAGGETLVFAILCNDARRAGGVAKAFNVIEQVVTAHIKALDR